VYKALSEAEKYNKVTSLTVADVCMLYFEIEVSQSQSWNKSQSPEVQKPQKIKRRVMTSQCETSG